MTFVSTHRSAPANDLLLNTWRPLMVNGGVILATFEVSNVDEAGHWMLSRRRVTEFGFLRCLFESETMRTLFPQLVTGIDFVDTDFVPTSPVAFDGDVAAQLYRGGAYRRFTGSGLRSPAVEVKAIANAFRDEVIGDRYDDFDIRRCTGAWSGWFHDVAWDCTWALIDLRGHSVTLLCATDTD